MGLGEVWKLIVTEFVALETKKEEIVIWSGIAVLAVMCSFSGVYMLK